MRSDAAADDQGGCETLENQGDMVLLRLVCHSGWMAIIGLLTGRRGGVTPVVGLRKRRYANRETTLTQDRID